VTPLQTLNAPDFPLEPVCGGGECFWWVTGENRQPTEEALADLKLLSSPELVHEGHGCYDWICWDEDGEVYRFVDRAWVPG
jgi:hypothetical protein